MSLSDPSYLKPADLVNLIGAQKVGELFDDDSDNLQEGTSLYSTLARAEGEAAALMLNNWSNEQVVRYGELDPAFRGHAAWVAVHFATERRPEYVNLDGSGRYTAQYDRAIQHFKALSKSSAHSVLEAKLGKGANSGGKIQPTRAKLNGRDRFTFSSSRNDPVGPGSF